MDPAVQPDYSQFVKKIALPVGFVMPRILTYEGVQLRALTRTDAQEDVAGINASLEIIRKTRGGDWPQEPTTEDFNFVYDAWHELEFEEGYSFTYTVRDADDNYLGCCYFYPMGRRAPLTPKLAAFDVDISWWVTPAAYQKGYYVRTYEALQHWLEADLPFKHPYFSNKELPV